MSRVAVIFTGGTISMLPDPETGAAMPSLDGAAILARLPELHLPADLEAIDWGLVPASHLSFGQILDLARLIAATIDRAEIDGVVVVQGTDTMEETAFAFDLLMGGDKPVVVTGAMRNAADPAWDGAANLSAAIRVAASERWRRVGTVVVMGDDVLPADDATKLNSQADDAFGAPNTGPLGVRRGRRRLERIPESAVEPVFLVTATVGLDGASLRALGSLAPRALVVAATGAGNTHPDLLAAAREQMETGIPVALTSRCVAGGVSPAYGFPGGGAAWLAAGAIQCGKLSGPKARIALALGLGAGLDVAKLRVLLAEPWSAS